VRSSLHTTARPGVVAGESLATFLVTADAVVADWFARVEPALGIRVCDRAHSPEAAERLIRASVATVFVIDQELSGGTGIELIERLRRSGVAAPMLLMSSRPIAGLNEGAKRAGASGTVVRADRTEDLAWTIAAIARGRSVWDERNPPLTLATPRELEVLTMIAEGLLTSQIAAKLSVSSETVKSHVQRVLLKFDAHTRAEAVAIAVRAGVV
jgi:DNA-binding NarL/FixJ family response regulator